MIRFLLVSAMLLAAPASYGHFDYKTFKQVFEKAPALVKGKLAGFSGMQAKVNDHDIDAIFCQYDSDEEIHTVTTGVRCNDTDHTGNLTCAEFTPSSKGKECKVASDDNIAFDDYVSTIVKQSDDIINFQGKDRVFQNTFRRTERTISVASANGLTLINCRLNGAKRLLSVFQCTNSAVAQDGVACTLDKSATSEDLCKLMP